MRPPRGEFVLACDTYRYWQDGDPCAGRILADYLVEKGYPRPRELDALRHTYAGMWGLLTADQAHEVLVNVVSWILFGGIDAIVTGDNHP